MTASLLFPVSDYAEQEVKGSMRIKLARNLKCSPYKGGHLKSSNKNPKTRLYLCFFMS